MPQPNDLFSALPAELRNRIFEYALVMDEPVTIAWTSGTVRTSGISESWSEPGLLRTSKAIRAEASAMYYVSNEFDITIKPNRLGNLRAWLRHLVRYVGRRPFSAVRLHISGAGWANLYQTESPATVFFDTRLSLPIFYLPDHKPWEANERGWVKVASKTGWRVHSTLNVLVWVGCRAAKEGYTKDQFEASWTRVHRTLSKNKDINAARAALEAEVIERRGLLAVHA